MFIKNTQSAKKALEVVDFEQHLDKFLELGQEESEISNVKELLGQNLASDGCEILLIQGLELLLSLEKMGLKILRALNNLVRQKSSLSKEQPLKN